MMSLLNLTSKESERMVNNSNNNNTLVTVDPYQGNEWIKWCSATIYLGSMICCGFLGKTLWKEMSKKIVLFSFRPVTQQLLTFAIIEVNEIILTRFPNPK